MIFDFQAFARLVGVTGDNVLKRFRDFKIPDTGDNVSQRADQQKSFWWLLRDATPSPTNAVNYLMS